MSLKPQDVVVALKLCIYRSGRPPFSQVASDLAMSPSEVHAAVKRLEAARLIHGRELNGAPNISALQEFLLHGLKYVFPAERGEMGRGMLTSYAAEPLKDLISPGNEPPPVWPFSQGHDRGVALQPLYRTAPMAALKDSVLYQYLALVDAIRDGRTRERKLAERELSNRLHKIDVTP
jgi:DNA-binding Lrp family transcriptional regulator